MVAKVGPTEYDLLIKYGGGLHTRAAEDDIGDREAADGQNFTLDLERRELRPRAPFDLVGTVPNAASVLGGGSLLKADGTVKAFFQGGTKVYLWDGTSFQASPVLATVSATAKLRGHFSNHAWPLTDEVLVTDLSLVEVVKKFTGSAMSNVAFLSSPSSPFGTFYAKYCKVSDERAVFAHVKDPSTTSRHMIVGSKRSDYNTISVSNRPSTALSASDPYFLLSPDLKPINGLVEAFGGLVVSTEQGQLYNLTGTSAKDFAFADFYPGSAAVGAESLTFTGNDVVYGRRGRIESVRDTNRFGNSEAADLSRNIAGTIEAYTGWTTVFNSRLRRVYMFPTSVSEVWVFDVAMRDDGTVSPWMRWKTSHSLGFQPTFVLSMLDPRDGLEYIFMGDSAGHVYRLEGSGTSGDGGSTNISVEFLSKLFSLPLNQTAFDIVGYIKYRKNVAATVQLSFEYAGEAIFNQSLTVSIPAIGSRNYYAHGVYYAHGSYFGTISGRLARQPIFAPGRGNEFQVRTTVDGAADFAISEIGLRFRAAA